MASIMSNPWSFAYHVGKDLIVNGVQIFHEVDDSITQFHGKHYYAFGEDIGEALSKLIIGGADIPPADLGNRDPNQFWALY